MSTPQAPEEPAITSLPAETLELDPENPRLPEEKLGAPEHELLTWLNDEEVLTELASSMITNGFFAHEPVVVLPANAHGKHIVLEGNRRFGAISILLQLPSAVEADIRFDFAVQPEAWQLDRIQSVPALVVPDRDAVRKFLGYRHIGGLRTWSPDSKARYLEQEIETAISEGHADPFREVARRVGSTPAAVRGQYVALKVLRAAPANYNVDSSFIVKRRFGVWNRLMNSPDVRAFIGYGDARTVEEIDAAVENLNPTGLRQVIGDLTPLREGAKAVLNDSRDVTTYGAALANPRALEAIVQYRDIRLARQIVEGGAIGDKLRALTRSIDRYVQDLDSYDLDEEVETIARGLSGSARTLLAGIRERVSDED